MTVNERPRRWTCPVVSQKWNIVSDVSAASEANTGPILEGQRLSVRVLGSESGEYQHVKSLMSTIPL